MTTVESTSPPNLNWLKWGFIISAAIVALFALVFASRSIFSGRSGTISLKASGLQFSETEIRVQAGQPVKLEFFNTDGYPHAFEIDEFEIHVELPGSKTTEVTLTPSEPGTYLFYCGVYGHKEAGMVGTFVVEP